MHFTLVAHLNLDAKFPLEVISLNLGFMRHLNSRLACPTVSGVLKHFLITTGQFENGKAMKVGKIQTPVFLRHTSYVPSTPRLHGTSGCCPWESDLID